MRVLLIADAFPPMRTSGAVQMRDLAHEFLRQGHRPTVLVPSQGLGTPWKVEQLDGVEVVRLASPRTKDCGYLRRTFAELMMPLAMLYNLRRSPVGQTVWDSVVWYSPSIFLGLVANWIKVRSGCPSYLIVRDIFPEWAVDMGIMGRGLPYRFFKLVEHYQYSVADTIGVQTPANLRYFDRWAARGSRRVEVLQNWLAAACNVGCSVRVDSSKLAGRTIFVYAGNMGVAQGMDVLLKLAERLQRRTDIGFLFVGRGSESSRLRDAATRLRLDNVVFHDEIDPTEIAGLYAQCHVGIVALDPRHKTHNIPGKFLSYMQAGLPVLANVNSGNDLVTLIERERVGRACSDHSVYTLERLACELVEERLDDVGLGARCAQLAAKMFSPEAVANQVLTALARSSMSGASKHTAVDGLAEGLEEPELHREEA